MIQVHFVTPNDFIMTKSIHTEDGEVRYYERAVNVDFKQLEDA